MRRMPKGITAAVATFVWIGPVCAQNDHFVGPQHPQVEPVAAEAGELSSDIPLAPASPAAAIEERPLGLPEGGAAASRFGAGGASAAAERATPAAPIEVGPGWWRTAGALVMVVAVILLIAGFVRKLAGRSNGLMHALGAGGRAPSGLLQVLGRYPVGRGQTLILLRLDRRVLLLCQSVGAKGAGMRTLCEVTDPDEVASLLLHAADAEGRSISAKFRDMVSGFDEAHVAREVAMQPVEIPESRSPRQTDPVNQLASRLDGLRQRNVEITA